MNLKHWYHSSQWYYLCIPHFQKPARIKLNRWLKKYPNPTLEVGNEKFILRTKVNQYLDEQVKEWENYKPKSELSKQKQEFWKFLAVERRKLNATAYDIDLEEWVSISDYVGDYTKYYPQIYVHIAAKRIRTKKVFGFRLYNRYDIDKHRPEYSL